MAAVAFRRDQEMTRNTLESSALETVPGFVQARVLFLRAEVLTVEVRRGGNGRSANEGPFCWQF